MVHLKKKKTQKTKSGKLMLSGGGEPESLSEQGGGAQCPRGGVGLIGEEQEARASRWAQGLAAEKLW